jgi:hypothetical protein
MWSGEDVIADQVGDLVDTIVIRNPIVAIPAGNGQMGFAPWSPLLKDKDIDLEVTKKYIVYISEAQDQIVEQYEEMFSLIKSPSKKLIM